MEKQILKILVIEDNQGDLQLIKFLLAEIETDYYFDLDWSSTFKLAKNSLLKHNYDAVLLNLNLPDKAGLCMIDEIHEINSHIPIIILTGQKNDKIISGALEKGAQDFLIKGEFAGDVLNRAIINSIERNRLKIILNEQKFEIQKAENRLNIIVSNNIDALFVLDREKKILFANPAAYSFFQKINGLKIGAKFIYDIQINKSIEKIIELSAVKKLFVELTTVEINWEDNPGYLVIMHDITDRKNTELELIATQKRLEEALQKIRVNQRKLVEMEKLKSVQELAAGFAHEISQPLQAITNYISILKEADPQNLYLNNCQNMVKRIENISADLRNITQLEMMDYLTTRIIDLKASSGRQKIKSGINILVVDDEESIRETLVEMFRIKNLNCDGAENGKAALEKLDQKKYDLIVSDVMMPVMSGPEFYKEFKKRELKSKFIFLTGYEIPVADKAIIKEADTVFTKPLKFDELLKHINTIL